MTNLVEACESLLQTGEGGGEGSESTGWGGGSDGGGGAGGCGGLYFYVLLYFAGILSGHKFQQR